ncbi:MAG: hypothetical protein IPK26_27530 [Planctomycetes bacterium]|nr:hypothetical protein [Planctomycetota bacterium]
MNSRTEEDPFRDVDERLADWVDGRLSSRDRERFEAEMRVSPRLREEAEAYRRSVQAVQAALRASGPRVDLADRVLAKLRERPAPAVVVRSRAPWRPLPIMASLAAAAAIVISIVAIDAWSPGAPLSKDVAAQPELADALRGMVAAPQPDGSVSFTAPGGLLGQGQGEGALVLGPPPPANAPDRTVLLMRSTTDDGVPSPAAVPGLPIAGSGAAEAKAGEATKMVDPASSVAPSQSAQALAAVDPTAPVTDKGHVTPRPEDAKEEGAADKQPQPTDAQPKEAQTGGLREQDRAKSDVPSERDDTAVAKSIDAKKDVAPGRSGRGAPLGRPKAKSNENGDDSAARTAAPTGDGQSNVATDGVAMPEERLRLAKADAAEPQVPVLVVTSRAGKVSRWVETDLARSRGATTQDLRKLFADREESAGQWLAGLEAKAPLLQRLSFRAAVPVELAPMAANSERANRDQAAMALSVSLLPAEATAASGWLVEGGDDAVAQVLRQVGRFARAEGLELSTAELGESQVEAMVQQARESLLTAASTGFPAVAGGGAGPDGSVAGGTPSAGAATAAGRTVPEPKPAPTAAKPPPADAEVPPRRVVLLFRELPPLPPPAEAGAPPSTTSGDGKK